MPATARKRSPAGIKAERAITHAESVAFAQVEIACGGRGKLIELLTGAPLSPEEDRLLGLIADPANDARPLAEICALVSVPRSKVYDLVTASLKARAKMSALIKIAAKTPEVASSLMDDAVPGQRTCAACQGLGQVEKPPVPDQPNAPVEFEKCKPCRGRGQIAYAPELDIRKVALQLGGLLERSGGVTVSTTNILQQNAGVIQAGTYDRLIAAADGILYGRGRERLSGGGRPDAPDAVAGGVAAIDAEVSEVADAG